MGRALANLVLAVWSVAAVATHAVSAASASANACNATFDIRTSCMACVEAPGCGWCAPLATCMAGNVTDDFGTVQPLPGTCPGDTEAWAAFGFAGCPACTGSYVSILNCPVCLDPSGSYSHACGWCATTPPGATDGRRGVCMPANNTAAGASAPTAQRPPQWPYACADDAWYTRPVPVTPRDDTAAPARDSADHTTTTAVSDALAATTGWCPASDTTNCGAQTNATDCQQNTHSMCVWCMDSAGAGTCVALPQNALPPPTDGAPSDACPGGQFFARPPPSASACASQFDCQRCGRTAGCYWCATLGTSDGHCVPGSVSAPFPGATCDARAYNYDCFCPQFGSCVDCHNAFAAVATPCLWCELDGIGQCFAPNTTRTNSPLTRSLTCPADVTFVDKCGELTLHENVGVDVALIVCSGVALVVGLAWFHHYRGRQLGEPLAQPFPDATYELVRERTFRKVVRWVQLQHPLTGLLYWQPRDGFTRARRGFCIVISTGLQLSIPLLVLISRIPSIAGTMIAVGVSLVLERPIIQLVQATGRSKGDGTYCSAICCRNCCLHCVMFFCFFQLIAACTVLFIFVGLAFSRYDFDGRGVVLSWLAAVLLGWLTAVPKQMALCLYDIADATREMNRYSRLFEPAYEHYTADGYDGSGGVHKAGAVNSAGGSDVANDGGGGTTLYSTPLSPVSAAPATPAVTQPDAAYHRLADSDDAAGGQVKVTLTAPNSK